MQAKAGTSRPSLTQAEIAAQLLHLGVKPGGILSRTKPSFYIRSVSMRNAMRPGVAYFACGGILIRGIDVSLLIKIKGNW
jgi:hypothetical protein